MATKKASNKKITKNSLNNSAERITKTAKTVNTEIVKTAGAVMDDVMSNTKELQTLATKTVKEAGKKIKLAGTVDKITKTAKTVNKQVMATAEEVFEDAKASGKKMTDAAAKRANEAIKNLNVNVNMDDVKTAAKNANKFALETTEEVIEGVVTNGGKWQGVANKAVKGGLKLAEKQQEIVFDTLETVKGQLTKSASRMWNLFRN